MANISKPVIAAFDFDGTLTYRDSLFPFLWFIAGPKRALMNLALEIPHLTQYLTGKIDRQGLKEAFLTRFLKNKSKEEVHAFAYRYVHEKLIKMVRPEGLQRIEWHKNQGHRCVLISANLELYLKPWGEKHGFDDVIASKMEYSAQGLVTGRLIGLNCRGEEKVRRLEKEIGPNQEYILYAYGDSAGDKELLALADHSFYRRLK